MSLFLTSNRPFQGIPTPFPARGNPALGATPAPATASTFPRARRHPRLPIGLGRAEVACCPVAFFCPNQSGRSRENVCRLGSLGGTGSHTGNGDTHSIQQVQAPCPLEKGRA